MMRSTEMSMDDQIRSIHHKYQIPEDEAKEILSTWIPEIRNESFDRVSPIIYFQEQPTAV